MKTKKVSRENFMFTPQISEMLQGARFELDISKNELAGIAIFDFLQNAKNFVNCEMCKKKIAIKQTLPGGCPIIEMPCKCGAVNWYDYDNDLIVKFNKPA